MFDIKRLQVIDGEPRISYLDLARALGFNDAQMVRDIIKRCDFELKRYGTLAPRWTASTGKRSRPAVAYMLNEAQAIRIAIKSGAPNAEKVRRALLEVFNDWRRGILAITRDLDRKK
jgi:prophage antirepressor-like protein